MRNATIIDAAERALPFCLLWLQFFKSKCYPVGSQFCLLWSFLSHIITCQIGHMVDYKRALRVYAYCGCSSSNENVILGSQINLVIQSAPNFQFLIIWGIGVLLLIILFGSFFLILCLMCFRLGALHREDTSTPSHHFAATRQSADEVAELAASSNRSAYTV